MLREIDLVPETIPQAQPFRMRVSRTPHSGEVNQSLDCCGAPTKIGVCGGTLLLGALLGWMNPDHCSFG